MKCEQASLLDGLTEGQPEPQPEMQTDAFEIRGGGFVVKMARDLGRLHIRLSGRYPEELEKAAGYLEAVNASPAEADRLLRHQFRKEINAKKEARW